MCLMSMGTRTGERTPTTVALLRTWYTFNHEVLRRTAVQ